MARYTNNGSQAPDYRNKYKKEQMYKQERKDWLEKMKADLGSGTGVYGQKQGGPNVANRNFISNQATDPYQLPRGQKPTLSNQGPYQMPGGPGPISVDPRSGGMGPNAGPRPQQPPTFSNPQPQYAPGQQAYNGPAIVPMGRPPQSAFGQGNWPPGGYPPPGMPGPPVIPYRPSPDRRGQRQFMQTTW